MPLSNPLGFKHHPLEGAGIYIYIPRTQLTSIFEGQPSKTRPFSIKTRVIWVLGIYKYIYIYKYVNPQKTHLILEFPGFAGPALSFGSDTVSLVFSRVFPGEFGGFLVVVRFGPQQTTRKTSFLVGFNPSEKY